MKRLLLILLPLLAIVVSGCKYDDDDLWSKVDELDGRVTKLEQLVASMNTGLEQIRSIVNNLQSGVNITSVKDTDFGYEITFSDGKVIDINNGKDGLTPYIGENGNWWLGTTDTGVKAAGEDGQDGTVPTIGDNGNWWIGSTDTGVKARGSDGTDGITPTVGDNGNWWIGSTDTGIKAIGGSGQGADGIVPHVGDNGNWWIGSTDTGVKAIGDNSTEDIPFVGIAELDGVYYWNVTINGTTTWLTDDNGNKLRVDGGPKPIVWVDENYYWRISYDGGNTFLYIYDQNGMPQHLESGCDCTQFFKSVTVIDNYLVLVLIDGTEVRIKLCTSDNPRLDSVIPKDIQDEIDDYMPLYSGDTPPNVEGAYFIDPFVTVYCQDYTQGGIGGYAPGDLVISEVIRFSNQDATNNTLNFDAYEGTVSTDTGVGAFISGSGNNFTAFFNTTGQTEGINTKTALVISGTKTSAGIANLYYAFVMVEKGSDPSHKLMNEGVFRIFKDQDGLSVPTEWNPPTNTRAAVPMGHSKYGIAK